MRTLLRIAVGASALLLGSPAGAAELKVARDVPYAQSKHKLQTLDVYYAEGGERRPVVFWIHGGGWRQGDKGPMHKKPQAFVDRGFVVVSVNYRLFPEASAAEMTADIARGVRWVHDHARDYGGAGDSIFVMGHSAGAHLAALVCTDDQYLKAEGLSLAIVKGCVPVDVAVYDIPKRIADSGSVGTGNYVSIFGKTPEEQRVFSPAAHLAKDKNIPPFLILHVADHPERKVQSEWFAAKLQETGLSATIVAAEGRTHGTINSELGLPEDKPTQALWKFLDEALKK